MKNSALTTETPTNLSTQDDSAMIQEVELVDESILQQMIKDTSADVIPILIDHYVQESQTRIAAIKQASTANDSEALEFEVHTLGSTALALGNRPLSTLSRKLEKQCLEQNHELAFSQIDELLDLAVRSIDALIARKEAGFS
ncbi:Hpt domain-containing protein [Vibrio apostichopi]|uniref:Hpt domain-containing protein n=1 Tax=Vibrio apostichopi TaxID=3035453 RepID=UPI0025733B5C|nr:Hpt domain-containing protein [Vibrio sp. FE10]